MNDKNLMTPEERAMAEMLEDAAEQVNVSPSFKTELEKKLMNAHQPKSGIGLFSFRKIASTAGWAIGWALLILMFIWVARTLAPQPQPAAANTPFPSVETAAPESLVPEHTFDFTVKEGDTCGFIAFKYETTVEKIVALNGLTDTCTLTVGQVIKIPIKTSSVISTPQGDAYSWNGTSLYLNAPLPEAPAEAKIYITEDEVFATVNDVDALAGRFGMNGEIYQITGDTGSSTDYLAVDGNQQLRVRSDRYFTYFPDTAGKVSTGVYNDNSNAEALINEFMQAHGFNFEYRIERSQLYGAYIAMPLTPDGFALHHEHLNFSGIRFYFNKESIEYLEASLLKYDETAAASIISAQEAFDKLLDPIAGNGAGVLMGVSSGSGPEEESWRRIFPLDQTITYFGYMNSTGKSINGSAPLVTLDGYTVTGNIGGVTENMQNVFVNATGQFHDSDGYKTFEIQTWKIHDGYDEGYVGTIQREGEQVVINTLEGNKLIIPDMPSEIPLPFENVYIMGVTQGDTFEWKSFDTRMAQGGGGGGGGGGQGFYQLNLTGTPVPLPTPMPAEAPPSTEGMPVLEGTQGILHVILRESTDGSLRPEYGLYIEPTVGYASNFIQLEGDGLADLQIYNHLPVNIWATPDHIDGYGVVVMKVSHYEIPYPDLKTEIIQGAETLGDVNGQSVALVTTEQGITYAELYEDGSPAPYQFGDGDQVQVKALLIPDETFGEYPAIRVIGSQSPVVDPSTIPADSPFLSNEPDILPEIPTLTIERVELVYYMPDPHFVTTELTIDQRYLQPAWLFRGHYSDGSEFEYLIQALKDEFLLPELAPYTQPG